MFFDNTKVNTEFNISGRYNIICAQVISIKWYEIFFVKAYTLKIYYDFWHCNGD